jgi:vancomycin aglycone glucosyltransferase
MKFVLAGFGSRGDVEPCVAVGVELCRRGHEVRMAVPPIAVEFVESVGLPAVAYGPDLTDLQPLLQDADFLRGLATKLRDPLSALSEMTQIATPVWTAKSAKLASLSRGVDLLLAGITEQDLAANVAEFHGIPLAALHFFPAQVLRSEMRSHTTKLAQDTQRRALGLPEAIGPTKHVPLEIQAYDELCFPELAAEWAQRGERRPFVGALRLESPPDADKEVLSWIAEATPPIYFGFGSTPIGSFAEIVAIIGAVCTQLGERALICTGGDNVPNIPHASHVKIVGAVDHPTVFPACRAVVHHGGAGTTAAGLRAGIPALILWFATDQPLWADAVERLKVGSGRPFSATTRASLAADLRRILTPEFFTRAREVAAQTTKPAKSIASAADLLVDAARMGRFG